MSRPKKILLGIIIFAAVFTISVFVKNVHVNYRYPSNYLINYLDIQMDIHHRMYTLITDIDSAYAYKNSSEDIKLLLNYIEKLHEETIVLGNSNSNRLAKITTRAEDPESLRWISERLIWVMQPMDRVSDKDDKLVILIMTKEIEYLHGSLMFLAGGGIGMEEAMSKAKDFKKKFQK